MVRRAPAARLLSQFMPTLFGADRTLDVASMLDGRLLAFGAGARAGVGAALRRAAGGARDAPRPHRRHQGERAFRLPRFGLTGGQAMVAAQTALAIVLLVGAGLFLRTLTNLRSADLGFRAERPALCPHRTAVRRPRAGAAAQFFEDAVERLRALPGVDGRGRGGVAPIGGDTSVGVGDFSVAICPPPAYARQTATGLVALNTVTPGYFQTMGVPIVAGRDFTLGDTRIDRTRRLGIRSIVNQAFARDVFPGDNRPSATRSLGNDCDEAARRPTIVGVVRDSRADLRAAAAPTCSSRSAAFAGPVTLIVRTAGDPAAMIPTVRRAMTELNANTPTFSEAPLAELVERRLRRERLLSSLLRCLPA